MDTRDLLYSTRRASIIEGSTLFLLLIIPDADPARSRRGKRCPRYMRDKSCLVKVRLGGCFAFLLPFVLLPFAFTTIPIPHVGHLACRFLIFDFFFDTLVIDLHA